MEIKVPRIFGMGELTDKKPKAFLREFMCKNEVAILLSLKDQDNR